MMGVKAKITTMCAASVLAAALIGGCATPQVSKSDEAILLERAKAYWEARFTQDMERAFSFEDPVRQKKLNVVGYIRIVGEPGTLYAVTVKGATIQGDQADVEVEIRTRPAMSPWNKAVLTSTITDDWQKIDGVWHHVLDFHMIRAGKPRVFVDRGTIEYPPQPTKRLEQATTGAPPPAAESPMAPKGEQPEP